MDPELAKVLIQTTKIVRQKHLTYKSDIAQTSQMS